MHDDLKEKAIKLFNELHEEASKFLEMDGYLISGDSVEKLKDTIKSDDQVKLQKFIDQTQSYIDNIKG